MKIGERIKQYRKANKLTQQALADIIGVNRVTITKYENGIIEPSLKTLEKLSSVFNIDSEILFQHLDLLKFSDSFDRYIDAFYQAPELEKFYLDTSKSDFLEASSDHAMLATLHYFAAYNGYLFELIPGKNDLPHVVDDVEKEIRYHFFNDTESYYFSYEDLSYWWGALSDHLSIDFLHLIIEQRDQASIDELQKDL